jgi:hypothetical protein
MLSNSKKGYKKKTNGKGVVTAAVKDYSKEPFFVQKAETAKKTVEKYGLPKAFVTGKK